MSGAPAGESAAPSLAAQRPAPLPALPAEVLPAVEPVGRSAAGRPDVLFHVVLLVLCGGVPVLSLALSVEHKSQVVVPLIGRPLPELCFWRRMTGLDCPGCGLTRCFIALAHGDVAAAWRYNPAGILLFGLVAAQVPLRAVQLWRIRRGARELPLLRWAAPALGALVLAIFAQWALRLAGVPF